MRTKRTRREPFSTDDQKDNKMMQDTKKKKKKKHKLELESS